MHYFSKSFLSFYTSATPRSKMPSDAVEISKATYDAMLLSMQNGLVIKANENGQPVASKAAQETSQNKIEIYAHALKSRIHDLAREWEYESTSTAATYLHSSILRFAAEAKALIDFRDKAWHNAHILFTRIKEGTSDMPKSETEFMSIVLPPIPVRPKG